MRSLDAPGQSLVTSKTFWGSSAAIFAAVVGGLQHIDPQDLTAAFNLIVSIAGGIGGLIAIWGRVTATQQITGIITK